MKSFSLTIYPLYAKFGKWLISKVKANTDREEELREYIILTREVIVNY